MSPSAHFTASTTLLLPHPFGPTTAVIPSPNSKTVRSQNDLNPWISRRRIFMEGGATPFAGRVTGGGTRYWIGARGQPEKSRTSENAEKDAGAVVGSG